MAKLLDAGARGDKVPQGVLLGQRAQGLKKRRVEVLVVAHFFKFVKSLQVYSQIMDKNTTLVLSTDSELFEYLNAKELSSK